VVLLEDEHDVTDRGVRRGSGGASAIAGDGCRTQGAGAEHESDQASPDGNTPRLDRRADAGSGSRHLALPPLLFDWLTGLRRTIPRREYGVVVAHRGRLDALALMTLGD
jgi:hypothetical protein